MSYSAQLLRPPFVLLLGFVLTILVAIGATVACGSDTGGGDADGGVPAEGSGVDPRIKSAEGTYTIDDLKVAGVKANKEYDVEELPGADAAWRIIYNRLDYEVRFYPDHQTLLDEGIPYVEHVTGDDAVVIGDDVIWEEGAKDRRRCSRDANTPHSGCAYSPRYWDYVVVGNMIMMCEGLESKQSIENCEKLLEQIP
ncbi:MAG: hypothetical protein OXC83_03380 [Chloroflexi bacterium]|nr:hypothetical protein [Chloroflexota bacterium]